VITYLISDSFCEVILIAGSIIAGAPLAILPTQILWINIVNDGLPNFSLAFEKGDKGMMTKKPVKKEEPIINKEMKIIIFAAGLIRDFFVLGIFYYLLKNNFDLGYIRTLVFAAVGVDSLMYIFSLRSLERPIWRLNPFSNLYLVGAVAISLLLLLAAIYWPPLQSVLATSPLSINSWLLVVSTGLLSIAMIEIIKYYSVRRAEG
jgi:P-type Ca2+ transporter type 2C